MNLKIQNNADEDLKSKAKVSIKTFALEQLYNTHLDIVRDLIRNGIVNSESRIKELYIKLPKLFSSPIEVM